MGGERLFVPPHPELGALPLECPEKLLFCRTLLWEVNAGDLLQAAIKHQWHLYKLSMIIF